MPSNITSSNIVLNHFFNNSFEKKSDNIMAEKFSSLDNGCIVFTPNIYLESNFVSDNKEKPINYVSEEILSVENKSMANKSSVKLTSHDLKENKECYSNHVEEDIYVKYMPLDDSNVSTDIVSNSDQSSEATESIYMDMTRALHHVVLEQNDSTDEQNDSTDEQNAEASHHVVLETSDSIDKQNVEAERGNNDFNECELQEIRNSRPKLPQRNLTSEEKEILTSKIKSELAGYIENAFTNKKIKISKHKLIEGFNNEVSLKIFSLKNIDDVNIEDLIYYYIDSGLPLDYKIVKNDEKLINDIKNYLFVYSYIFNKNVKQDVTGFFTEDFSKINKLHELQKINLYADIVEKIVDCIIDKKTLIESLVIILNNKENGIKRKLDYLSKLIKHKGQFIGNKENAFNQLKKIIESSVEKLNKTGLLNKIKLSEESKKMLIIKMIKKSVNGSFLSMDNLSNLIIDESKVKKKITSDFLKKIEYIPEELLLSKENRKFTNGVINSFIEELKDYNINKIPNDIQFYYMIDIELTLLYFKSK
ncbi:hypothetical protein [Proteus vulgaris]|uniref:hypothetical protein n=1 Tax=Proteus vulgaris TaxID=585 RepID=UPI003C7B97EF